MNILSIHQNLSSSLKTIWTRFISWLHGPEVYKLDWIAVEHLIDRIYETDLAGDPHFLRYCFHEEVLRWLIQSVGYVPDLDEVIHFGVRFESYEDLMLFQMTWL